MDRITVAWRTGGDLCMYAVMGGSVIGVVFFLLSQ